MLKNRSLTRGVICLAVSAAMVMPTFAVPPSSAVADGNGLAADPTPQANPSHENSLPPARIADVRLDAEGRLMGLLIDGDGVPLGRRELVLQKLQPKAAPVPVKTDAAGRFTSGRLSGGLYEVRLDRRGQVVRLWEKQAAPPKALPALLVIAEDTTVRGQRRVGEVLSSDTIVIGGLVAAAIAIPLAVSGSDDGPSSP